MSLQVTERSPLAGAQVVGEILRAVVVTATAVAVVWVATSTSRRLCGPIPDSWWDGFAPPADAPEERCAILHLEPSPLVLVALVFVLIFSIARVLRVAQTPDDGGRILSRAVTAIVIIAAATVVVSQAWLWVYGYPSDLPNGDLLFVPPFPFAWGSAEEEAIYFAVVD